MTLTPAPFLLISTPRFFFPHLDDTVVAHEPWAKYDSIAAEETPSNPLKTKKDREFSSLSF